MIQEMIRKSLNKLSKISNHSMKIKRMIYISCFVGLCVIDQMIGSATGYIQHGLKNYTGIILAIIILTAYKPKDFIKIPYLIWVVLFFGVRYYLQDWLCSIIYNDIEVETNLWGIGIYGIVAIRMFYYYAIEKKKLQIRWLPFLICIAMLIGMSVIRTDYTWPKALCGALFCFYMTDFKEKDLNNLYTGIAEGIIIGFLIIQGRAWLFRPYDSTTLRYFGMYSHPNMNALFYMCAYSAVLCKWYLMKLRGQHKILRFPFIILAGIIVGTTVFTGSRTTLITMAVVTMFFLVFQFLSCKKWRIRELVIDIIALAISVVVCLIPSYCLIRYIPAYIDEPLFFEGDYGKVKVQKGDPINSEKYVELEEAMKGLFGRFFWFADEKEKEEIGVTKLDWKDILLPSITVYASNEEELHTEYIEPGADQDHPLLIGDDAKDPIKIRTSLYKYYISRLRLIGKEENQQVVWIERLFYTTHTHNVFLQMAYDFGVIIGVAFIFTTFMIYRRVFWGIIEKKRGSWYYRLFVTVAFATILVVFGMLELCWVYGQLSFTMFFIVQYVVYHKEHDSIQLKVKEKKEDFLQNK